MATKAEAGSCRSERAQHAGKQPLSSTGKMRWRKAPPRNGGDSNSKATGGPRQEQIEREGARDRTRTRGEIRTSSKFGSAHEGQQRAFNTSTSALKTKQFAISIWGAKR